MSAHTIIAPRRPTGPGWFLLPVVVPSYVTLGYEAEAWQHIASGLCVISAVEVAKDGDGIERGPEYHISITRRGQRCTGGEARWVVAQFGLDGAEEDNHVPGGKARNFWRPVANGLVGIECACKETEPAVREDRGDYVWRGVTG